MADYPSALVREHTLFERRKVTVRPVRADDERLETDFVRGLSGESRYLRFQKWGASPSQKLVAFLTHVDYDRHLALVCVASAGEREAIVGEARYVTYRADGRSARSRARARHRNDGEPRAAA